MLQTPGLPFGNFIPALIYALRVPLQRLCGAVRVPRWPLPVNRQRLSRRKGRTTHRALRAGSREERAPGPRGPRPGEEQTKSERKRASGRRGRRGPELRWALPAAPAHGPASLTRRLPRTRRPRVAGRKPAAAKTSALRPQGRQHLVSTPA
jgi:hypothetical protein